MFAKYGKKINKEGRNSMNTTTNTGSPANSSAGHQTGQSNTQ
jgi:hypothetical protein